MSPGMINILHIKNNSLQGESTKTQIVATNLIIK